MATKAKREKRARERKLRKIWAKVDKVLDAKMAPAKAPRKRRQSRTEDQRDKAKLYGNCHNAKFKGQGSMAIPGASPNGKAGQTVFNKCSIPAKDGRKREYLRKDDPLRNLVVAPISKDNW